MCPQKLGGLFELIHASLNPAKIGKPVKTLLTRTTSTT